ncbi:hypothetical protein OROHE_004398 [Orobanche hederae]
MPSQEILKIRDGTPLEAEGILTYQKGPRNSSVCKIRPSQEILKIRDGTPLEAEGILTYQKGPRNSSKKRVARIQVCKIRPSQEILKIRDGTPLEAEGILTYQKGPRNSSVWHFSSKLDVPSNVVQKKRVAQILVFKIRPSQEILKIRDGTPLEAEGILTYRKRPSKLLEILKIRDGTPLEAEGILTYQKGPRNSSKKRVARIQVCKIRPSQEILKIRDGTPLEAEGILTYQKGPRNSSVWHFSSKLDVSSNVVQKKRVARILVCKIRPSQEILKIRDGTPLEAEGILTYQKGPRNSSVWHFSSKPSQEILKIRDGTPLEAEGILTYQKGPRNSSVWHFSSKLDVPKILKIRDGTPLEAEGILTYQKCPRNSSMPSQEILKIRDGTPLEAEGILTYQKGPRNSSKKRVARIQVCKIRPSQEILKIRDGTPLEAEGILTYQKGPRNSSVWHFSSKLDVSSNVVQKKRVARILVCKIRPSQEILKIRDGTPLEAEGILTYQKGPRNSSVWHFSSKLDVPSNVV